MTSQKGFAHAFLIIGLVVALIGALGFVFWQNFIYKEPVVIKTEIVKQSDTVNESDSEMTQKPAYTLQEAIDDIGSVVAAEGCGGTGAKAAKLSFEQVPDQGIFKYAGGKSFINEGLTHAYVQYGCGSQGVVALLKKERSSWMLLNEDARVYPMCRDVRGQGFPSSVVDKCYENDKSPELVSI